MIINHLEKFLRLITLFH